MELHVAEITTTPLKMVKQHVRFILMIINYLRLQKPKNTLSVFLVQSYKKGRLSFAAVE